MNASRCTFLLFLQILLVWSLTAQQSYLDKKGNKHLWGISQVEQLEETPFGEWYHKGYDEYTSSLTPADGKLLSDCKVKVFIGTWCGDTKFLLPRFIKAWKTMGLDESQLEIIALHHEAENYKQGPNGESKGYNIHRVPTFIFEQDEKEIGRIVERSVFDLDTDLHMIAYKQPYQHRYKAATMVNLALDSLSLDSLHSEKILKKVEKSIGRELSLESELNTYAYVLLFSGEKEKAEFVFKLNRALFQYDPYVIHGYGKVLMENEKYEEAKKELLESLRINPDNAKAISYLAEINEKLKQKEKTE